MSDFRQLFSETISRAALLSAFWCLVMAGACGVASALRICSLHVLNLLGW